MPFEFPLRMHLKCFSMIKTFGPVTRMGPNALRMQSEFLEWTSNIQECTTNFHSDGIPAHSASSVTGVLTREALITYPSSLWSPTAWSFNLNPGTWVGDFMTGGAGKQKKKGEKRGKKEISTSKLRRCSLAYRHKYSTLSKQGSCSSANKQPN